MKKYEGTETALLTEIDVMEFGLPIRERLDALDRLVREHPGTRAGAKALHNKGFQLASGNVYPDIEARGADPTARFFRVLEIVQELESGRYPPCEWVDRALSLVTHFFAHNPTYAEGSIDRLLAAYKAFVKTHFEVRDEYPLSSDAGYIITTKMFDLFKAKGEGIAGVERVFSELEGEIDDVAALRFLRAQFYVRSMNWERAERATFYRKAVESLTGLEAQGNGLYHRKALATLASLLLFGKTNSTAARTEKLREVSQRVSTDGVGVGCCSAHWAVQRSAQRMEGRSGGLSGRGIRGMHPIRSPTCSNTHTRPAATKRSASSIVRFASYQTARAAGVGDPDYGLRCTR